MPPGPTHGAQEGDGAEPSPAEAEVDGARAAAEHWKRIARQRSAEYADLRHRPTVRALLAAERRAAPVWRRASRAAQHLRQATAGAALHAEGLARRPRRRPGRDDGPPPGASPSARRGAVLLAHVGTTGPSAVPAGSDVRTVSVASDRDVGPTLDRELDRSGADVVAVVLASTEPRDLGWVAQLVSALGSDAVAAAPLVVHPYRALTQATPHDGLVRAAGLALELDPGGVPVVWAPAAGQDPTAVTASEIVAASGAALVIDAAAYRAAGGLAAGDDLDAAVVELLVRLRDRGGRTVLVPDVVVTDHRPVRSRRELRSPVDPAGAAWAAVVERSGSLLRRAASLSPPSTLHLAITVAAPSAKVAARWGDWHLAGALAAGLRRHGHHVRLQTADHADDLAGRACDVHLVVRGLVAVRRTPGQRHVLWIISHPEAVDDDELDAADLVLVASATFADHLRTRTATPVEVFQQATDHRRFSPVPPVARHQHDVTIVAKSREVLRPVVADALAAGLRPAIYGAGWEGLVDPELVVADHVPNDELPAVYSSARVVLADHWGTMRAWGFVANRVFDVLACGTPVISDPVAGLAELLEGTVPEYRDPLHLRSLVDEVLADPDAARERAARGRELVLAAHTFDHRAQQLLALLDRYAKDA